MAITETSPPAAFLQDRRGAPSPKPRLIRADQPRVAAESVRPLSRCPSVRIAASWCFERRPGMRCARSAALASSSVRFSSSFAYGVPRSDLQLLLHSSSETFSATTRRLVSPGSLQTISSPLLYLFTVIWPVPCSSWMRRIHCAIRSDSFAMATSCAFAASYQHPSIARSAACAGLAAMSSHSSATPFSSVCASTSSPTWALLMCSPALCKRPKAVPNGQN